MKKNKKWFYLLGFDSINKLTRIIILIVLIIALTVEALVYAQSFDLMESLLCIDIGLPILLSSDYLNEVFAATCTIAVLGNAILSILFGVYDKKTLGIPFQDVLNHSVVGKEQRFTISALTMSIVFALMWYVWKRINLLFSVLIIDVVLLLFSCDDLWRFLSDKKMQRKTIAEVINEVDSSRYSIYVDNWFKELCNALVPNNSAEAKEYFELISLVLDFAPENKEQLQSCVRLHLQSYFDEACGRVGFVEAYSLLREAIKYAPPDDTLDGRIVFKYLEKLKAQDEVDIANFEISDLLSNLFEESIFDDSQKKAYAYAYFCAIFDNYQMKPEAKHQKLKDILAFLCSLEDEDYGTYKANVLMNIVKYNIINNDNINNRKQLFSALVEALKKQNYSNGKIYIQTISEIFRAFFFVIYLEDGSLTKNFREELLALFRTVTKDRDLVSLSFMTLIYENIDEVVSWLVLDSVSKGNKPRTFWGYWSLGMRWKKVVWTADEVISFAFCACHMILPNMDGRDFYRILQSNEFSCTEKIFICKTLLDLYNCDGYTNDLAERAQQMAEFCNIQDSINLHFWKQEHTYYQEKIIELESTINRIYLNDCRKSNQDLFQGVHDFYKDSNLFAYDPNVSLFPGKRQIIKSSYEYIYKNFWHDLPKRVSSTLREYLSWHLNKVLPQLSLSFRIEDITALISELDGKNYLYRNYQYTDNWALQKLSNTAEYQKLSKVLDDIYYDKSHQISQKIFLKKAKIPFNFQLQYELIELSEKQCKQYVEANTKDGLCTVGGYRLEPEHAKKYIKNNLLIENVTVFIHISLDSDDGFQIQIEH